MYKNVVKSLYFLVVSMAMIVFISVFAEATDHEDIYDTVELKNGDIVTGTVLNDTFTVTTPYTNATCEKDKISEITIGSEYGNHDVIALKTGGLLEGTIEELSLSFKLVSGEIISLEKRKCKKIILQSHFQNGFPL